MSNPRALTLCCCLAALPLIGCANGTGGPPQAYIPSASQAYAAQANIRPAPTPSLAGDQNSARFYAAGPGAPVAILVMMPGPGDFLTADPALWAAQGFDVVAPPSEPYQLAADQPAALDRLIDAARAMADAPIWLVGPNPAIEAAIAGAPIAGPGQVSGVVATSLASGTGTCSEQMTYSYSGNGAAPKVRVSKSGDACPPGAPFGVTTGGGVAPLAPMPPSHTPRLIEASVPAASALAGSPAASSRQAAVRRIAELIKSAPAS